MVHVADYAATEAYIERDPVIVAAVELGGMRTFLGVPMLKENELVGAFPLYRQEVRPFTDKQIALVRIRRPGRHRHRETRLLNELRRISIQQQTATADVLKVISRSTFDLQAVLDTLVEVGGPALRGGQGYHRPAKGRSFYFEAIYGFSREYAEFAANNPAEIDRGTCIRARLA